MPIPRTLSKDWADLLKDEFDKPYFLEIISHYKQAISNTVVFPHNELIFNAFNLTPLKSLRIVILGQDPYHGSVVKNGIEIPQAMGLSFSVNRDIPLPPSLKNIYKEIESTLGISMPNHGDLSKWAKDGVLLLNSILSVEKNKPSSHKHFGWEIFTDAVIQRISQTKEGIIFLLWGNFAKKKLPLISDKHIALVAPHPSPLARGFVGSDIFLRANQSLISLGKEPMDWRII